MMWLYPAAKADLGWWVDNVLSCRPKIQFHMEKSTLRLHVMLPKKCNKIATQGLWTTREQSKHINELELLSIKFALKVFKSQLSGKHVKIFSDNTTEAFQGG